MALSGNDKLILVRVKIERAKKHLADIETVVIPYRGMRSREYIMKGHRQPGEPPLESHDLPIIPFDALAGAGDVIQNLRSSLDHLAFQLFAVGSPGRTPSRRLCFPICTSADRYESEKAGKVEGMRADAKEAIDRLKPYRGGNAALWKLQELNNVDKHRFLLTAGSDVLCDAAYVDAPDPEHPYYWLKSGDPNFAGVFGVDAGTDTQSSTAADEGLSRIDGMVPTLQQLIITVQSVAESFRPLLE